MNLLRRWFSTQSKYGERYSKGGKITKWCCLIATCLAGILMLTHWGDMRSLAVGCAIAYFAILIYDGVTTSALRHRIKELLKLLNG